MNRDEHKNGVLPIEFQCKTTCNRSPYDILLNEMPGEKYKCILHNLTHKTKTGKFTTTGSYAILPLDDFIEILNKAYNN